MQALEPAIGFIETRDQKILGLVLPIQWTSYAAPALVQDTGINHSRLHILMAEQFLHRADIIARIE
jgi:hypothetical protein